MKYSCPICSSKSAPVVLAPELEPTDNNIKNVWSGWLREKVFFKYSRCKCGMLYCQHYPDNKTLEYLYISMENNEHSGNESLETATKKGYATRLVQETNKFEFQRVLEIGADNGRFIEELKKIAKVHEAICVEPNQNVHHQISAIPETSVYSCITDIEKLNLEFDLIVGIHVFDHVPDVKILLTKLFDMLADNGAMFAVVHNERSILARLFGKRWPAYCVQHPHLFNAATLKMIFNKVGLEKASVFRTTNNFTLGYLLQHLILALFAKKVSVPQFIPLPLKLGNIGIIGEKTNATEKL